MGARSARIFERGDAGCLIGVGARGRARIHMSDDERAVLAGVQIGIENAVLPAELELEARSLLNLKGGTAEMGRQLRSSKTREARSVLLHGSGLHRLLWRGRLLRPGGAANKDEG